MMKSSKSKLFLISAFASVFLFAKMDASADALTVGTVNLKNIGEKSKFGKHERDTFEAMQKQMESVLKEKEKKLSELASKLQDEDYLDSISAEAETELKREFRSLSQEFAQIQNQYYQTIQQANMVIMQKLSDIITKSADKVAQEKKIDLVINENMTYFASDSLDITDPIIVEMDKVWEDEKKESNNMAQEQERAKTLNQNQNRPQPPKKK